MEKKKKRSLEKIERRSSVVETPRIRKESRIQKTFMKFREKSPRSSAFMETMRGACTNKTCEMKNKSRERERARSADSTTDSERKKSI